MSVIENVIRNYGLHPYKIERKSGRLYKVSDGRHVYALKESRLTKNTVSTWEQVYHHAHAYHLTNILPVYLASNSHFFTAKNGRYYYLTPWIHEYPLNHNQAIRHAYEAIGRIHAKTRKSTAVEMAKTARMFEDYLKKCENLQQTLLYFVEQFERSHFMSPFELQVCTHYHVLVNVFHELDHCTRRLINELEDGQEWNYSLCHGNLRLSHFLHDRHTYLINWENATYNSAVSDLSTLLRTQAGYFGESPAQWAELFPSYNQINSLTPSEQYLLTIYLIDPSYYIFLVESYMKNDEQQTMVKQTQMLQSAFRQLAFGLKWAELIEYDDGIAASSNESET